MKLHVHLVTWNGAKYIPYLFESLRRQTFRDWELFVLDNASSDGTVEKIKLETRNSKLETGDSLVFVTLIESRSNTGFAGGHNLLFQETRNKKQETNEYILLLNQDMYLYKTCFERLVEFMDKYAEVGSATPLLLKWEFGKIVTGFDASFTDVIDSLGLRVDRNRRVREMFSGYRVDDLLKCLKGNLGEIFGVSGALPIYRRKALEDAAFSDGTIFDESYHAYKEDVDLAFRLQSAGWKSRAALSAIALHDRSAAGPEDPTDQSAAKNKKQQSKWVRYHSYKNHLMTLYKNEYWQNVLLDFPWIFWYEWKKFVWFFLFDRKVLGGLKEIWKMRGAVRNKKQETRNKRKVRWREMRKWWK
ncbi:MAG: hypothetical protein A3C90_01310 [Candidatus Magasanikbacteria bacterium RIFCSPHIGHO2_02_FULL_51_14]|uniref:Glycosyltransferase 2-like domain-containing protein n=1 Tax=Candidatus Magasanikbacteria bacterium RIFCSPHIGHO2_02_FULL_51_14 TaxID=1798683 RepID=A0A1F6MQB5_9BACT|nr:MAG: hypothetical protein A3C90_01310 [Candidatus Magasanikbacteria bacterium RIFCSPHIGHO2_02_FULL_51_14]